MIGILMEEEIRTETYQKKTTGRQREHSHPRAKERGLRETDAADT